jgi:hypothetical protein
MARQESTLYDGENSIDKFMPNMWVRKASKGPQQRNVETDLICETPEEGKP